LYWSVVTVSGGGCGLYSFVLRVDLILVSFSFLRPAMVIGPQSTASSRFFV
jgi:hypothetical protein